VTRTTPDIRDILRRGEELAHCERLRRWLRASIILNFLLLAAVAGIVAGYSSSYLGAPPESAPVFKWGTSK
jgi:hypothetical protein